MKYFIFSILLFSNFCYSMTPFEMEVVVNEKQKLNLKGVNKVKAYFTYHGGDFSIFSTDDVASMEKRLSFGLSSDPEKARKQADERINNSLAPEVMKAYKAKILTLKYKLDKYPAIIFNQKYIVYGELNLNKALQIFLNTGDKK
ncbi:hypothetical protein DS885_03975 [Psychromonas sp. B3M02]|uniref:DUF1525 domain-containing protein n=1 Tax=Psychromonas sp. B3M02 TaxID=2267226 RepID=UPI000DE8D590|nr:DUF1525 domain-containing protein [Psychromonas sp. B3M02]RBW47315.1 hypothetical protein DS885_03975 [Psychromonas sp. B3M02]